MPAQVARQAVCNCISYAKVFICAKKSWDMSSRSSNAANTANSLLVSFERGSTYLALAIATKPIAAMKNLYVFFQSRTASIDGK